MIKKINLIYWKCHTGFGNFGDEIGIFIISNLVNRRKYELVFNEKDHTIDYNLVAVGSHFLHIDNVYIYGSGLFLDVNKIGNNITFCSIRGPLTQKLLKNYNISCDVYGDCALLVPLFYTPNTIEELKNKIAVIPHHSNYPFYQERQLDQKFHLIDPTNKWCNVLDQLYSCKAVISASLHGLICSDAYNKPNVWLYEYSIDNLNYEDGKIKFYDYLLSQSRTTDSIPNLESYSEEKLYSGGNKINTEKLVEVFPFK